MTPVPSSPSDGAPLPPRHRPTLGELSKDTTEADLWDLEDELALAPEANVPRQGGARSSRELPSPRERNPAAADEADGPATKLPPQAAQEKVRINVNRARQIARPASGQSGGSSTPESEFDDLEQWDDERQQGQIGELPVEILVPAPEPPPEAVVIQAAKGETEEAPAQVVGELAVGQSSDEFTPVPTANIQPMSLRPALGLSKVEKTGMTLLVALLAALAGVAYMFSLNRLPRETERVRSTDFPIKGERVAIESAVSYWREPISDGASPDTFRRGTRLLPVLEMEVSGGPAAVRVLFRNEDRAVVGDVITRDVVSGVKLSIAATAGFDDAGMHAAYRTGESKPWTIEVYEAADRNAPGRDFKKVFEMNISTDLR